MEWEFGNILEGDSKLVRFEVGVGSRVSFSHDIWSGDQPLKISHLDLFSIALSKTYQKKKVLL